MEKHLQMRYDVEEELRRLDGIEIDKTAVTDEKTHKWRKYQRQLLEKLRAQLMDAPTIKTT